MAEETPDCIATRDWDRVHEAALELANASESEMREAERRMSVLLDELEQRYGRLPGVLATRADYLEDEQAREVLYLEAFERALSSDDRANLLLISHSLAQLYIGTLKDVKRGRRWLAEYRERWTASGMNEERENDATLARSLMALTIGRREE